MQAARFGVAVLMLSLAACSTIEPFEPGEAGPASTTAPVPAPSDRGAGDGPVLEHPPVIAEPTGEAYIDASRPHLPAERPVRHAPPPKLSPATQSLVNQAAAQRKRGDLPGAAITLDRALRIEPGNPLLWIEMGRLRLSQRNYAQADAMARKALSMSVGDAQTQATAWNLIADSLQARGRNPQAQEARDKAEEAGLRAQSLGPPR